MADETSLSELLLLWEDLRETGRHAAAEDLCRNRPELLPELRRRIRALEVLDEILDLPPLNTATDDNDATLDLSQAPTVPGYEILGELGRGGMGVVYTARDLRCDRLVALKMIRGESPGPGRLARFRGEAEAIARLDHPNVVRVHEVGEADGAPYYAMELVTGGSLADRLAVRPFPPARAAQCLIQLAGALAAAHGLGIIHRDLKPGNVLLSPDGVPKVADFGLARRLGGERRTASGTVLGTPAYMAPEQAGGQRDQVGPAADIYSLGAMFYEMLTGTPPFQGGGPVDTIELVRCTDPVPPTKLVPEVPTELERICLTCLRKDPDQRFASAQALAEALGAYLADAGSRPSTRSNEA